MAATVRSWEPIRTHGDLGTELSSGRHSRASRPTGITGIEIHPVQPVLGLVHAHVVGLNTLVADRCLHALSEVLELIVGMGHRSHGDDSHECQDRKERDPHTRTPEWV